MVVDDTLDLTLALKVADGNAGKRAVDLQTVNEHTGGCLLYTSDAADE